MSVLNGAEFGIKLCELLKLDPKRTKDVVITSFVDEPAMVFISQYLQTEDVDELLKIIEEANAENPLLTKELNSQR